MKYDLADVLLYLDPSQLDYQDWVNVGMALKDAGYGVNGWDWYQ